jgi:hypothetical protein
MNGDAPSVNAYQLTLNPFDDGVSAIELDSVLTVDNTTGYGGFYTSVTNSDYASFATITDPTSTSSGALITMSVKPINPMGKLLTVSFPINVIFNATSVPAVSHNQTVNMTATAVTMTKNGSSFLNFTYNDLTTTVTKVYTWTTTGGTANSPIQQPFYQMTVQFKPDQNSYGSANDVYVIKTTATLTKSGTGTRLSLVIVAYKGLQHGKNCSNSNGSSRTSMNLLPCLLNQ